VSRCPWVDPFGHTQVSEAIIVKASVEGWRACRALPFRQGAGAFIGDERLRIRGQTVPSVKGPVVEALTVGIPLDSFLAQDALHIPRAQRAQTAGLSQRSQTPAAPLSCGREDLGAPVSV
jgi:hypothetical protein